MLEELLNGSFTNGIQMVSQQQLKVPVIQPFFKKGPSAKRQNSITRIKTMTRREVISDSFLPTPEFFVKTAAKCVG